MEWTETHIYKRAVRQYNVFLAGNGNGGNSDRIGKSLNLFLEYLYF